MLDLINVIFNDGCTYRYIILCTILIRVFYIER